MGGQPQREGVATTDLKMGRENHQWIEVHPLIRHKGVNFPSWDKLSLKKYKAFYKLSKMNLQNKDQMAHAVSRHFAVNAVDDHSVLTGFLDEVKKQQDMCFDVSRAQPRIIRDKTKWDGLRGNRTAPY